MKQAIVKSLLVSALVGLLLVFAGGCTKKPVMPPVSAETGSSDPAGKDINYPYAEGGYSENSLTPEGTLDDTATRGVAHLGSMALDGSQGEPTAEYKQQHGRSSAGLSPVYFDFDQAGVRPDMAERMVMNAEYIKQVANTVIIEGNSDDRGTKEYNLALAERRAINVRDYLINLGVNATQIRTVSYGEERPLFVEQNEFAWSQNRRADFVLE